LEKVACGAFSDVPAFTANKGVTLFACARWVFGGAFSDVPAFAANKGVTLFACLPACSV
jgi:hypothetical protein